VAEVVPQRIVGAGGGALERHPGRFGNGEAARRADQRRAPRPAVAVDGGHDGQLLAGDEADGVGDDPVDDDPPVGGPGVAFARRPLERQFPVVNGPRSSGVLFIVAS